VGARAFGPAGQDPARIPNAPRRRRTRAKPQRGKVFAVGDNDGTIKVVPGDLILFAKYVGTDLRLDGEDYLILDTADLLAVIKAAAAQAA
jgi:co-chaperonin GroES (HSP10)